jgi:cell division protein FtsQ
MKANLIKISIIVSGLVLSIFLIAFTAVKQSHQSIKDLKINIVDADQYFFVDQPEILNLVNANNSDYVLGQHKGQLNLKELEYRVEENAFVHEAQVYTDLAGNLHVKVKQSKPIARFLLGSGRDRYVDDTGKLLPVNTKFTARVPLIEVKKKFPWKTNIMETDEGKVLFELLTFVENDPFWKAQIAQFTLLKNGEVNMLPQVTRQEIIFGELVDIELKFKKLKLFYTEVLPNKGWNTYASVNLKFKNQIICQ